MKKARRRTARKAADPSAEGQPRVLIVDDDDGVRESLSFLLESVGLAHETFATAGDFLEWFDPERCACVLLDVRMPGMSGLQLQQKLRDQQIDVPVIILTAYGDVPMAVRAMRAGAIDFIEKPCNDQLLLERIDLAIQRGKLHRAEQSRREQLQALHQTLTDREQEVMALITEGMSNREAAQALQISAKTVEVHRARAMKKMQASNLAELVRAATALENGL